MSVAETVLANLLVVSNVVWATFFIGYRSKVREMSKERTRKMTEVASLELSQKLYEVSGWGGTGDATHELETGTPAYTAGYLLRKLQQLGYTGVNFVPQQNGTWFVYSPFGEREQVYGDTPEDALCAIAIELFEQGVLKREDV